MARKRRRRKIKAGPILWALLVVHVAVGLLFSPVTAATRVRVVGAKRSDETRIERELQQLKDKPCLSVNGRALEEQILARPDVRTAELSRNLFGRGELVMSYYEPVALVNGTKNVVLTDAGFLCATPDVATSLPMLNLPTEAWGASFGLSGVWEPRSVAEVCERSLKQGIIKNLSITVTMGGSVCLNSGVTGRVMLGAPDELDEKFEPPFDKWRHVGDAGHHAAEPGQEIPPQRRRSGE